MSTFRKILTLCLIVAGIALGGTLLVYIASVAGHQISETIGEDFKFTFYVLLGLAAFLALAIGLPIMFPNSPTAESPDPQDKREPLRPVSVEPPEPLRLVSVISRDGKPNQDLIITVQRLPEPPYTVTGDVYPAGDRPEVVSCFLKDRSGGWIGKRESLEIATLVRHWQRYGMQEVKNYVEAIKTASH